MVIDYISKWMEVIATPTKDSMMVIKFLKKNIFTRVGTPGAFLSHNESHFYNKHLESLLKKYGVFHKVETPYFPQTSAQVELPNEELRNTLEKMVNQSRKDWSLKLDDALWAY